mmetsp:Transcript_106192/g.269744  ORF Transcript_106192/g.269744 Transcript_106192/m.269744 type:complete len:123 (-) Transcript_106192:107-475(-)
MQRGDIRGVEESNTASTQDVVLWERDPRSRRTFLQASRRSRPEFTGMASTVASASWCASMLFPWCCTDCSTSAALAASNSMELQFDLGAPSFLSGGSPRGRYADAVGSTGNGNTWQGRWLKS